MLINAGFMVQSLFDICVSVILGSSYLLERASLHLPRSIAHFLLYLAVESRNQLAVRNLVEKWPYRDLALDFLSNPVCRSHRMASQHCLEPHEYMGVFGSYARYSCHENVSSLLEGIFHNLFRYRKEESGAGLRTVDMSAVTVGGQQVSLLLNLVNGKVPVTHYSDYISSKEARTLRVYRPKLEHLSSHQPLVLYANIMLDASVSKQEIATLVEVCSQQQWVQVTIRGLTLLGLGPRALDTPPLHTLLNHATLQHIYFTEDCCEELAQVWNVATMSFLPSLWLSCEPHSTPSYHSIIPLLARMPRIGSFLLATSQRASELGAKLSKLAGQFLTIQAFCLLRQEVAIPRDLRQGLAAFLLSISEQLEYLQLRRWSLTSTDLDSLLRCSNLRVLCVTEECGETVPHYPLHSASDIFVALSQLTFLEFFQWSENINMTTAGLLSLYHLLSLSLHSLRHFHMHLPFLLLSTTDLQNEEYSILGYVLLPLLTGKTGDESCTTYRFYLDNEVVNEWLMLLRSEVCFRLGKQVECVTELHQAATLGSYVY